MRPKVICSVHYCPQTKKTFVRRYTDFTLLDTLFPSSSVYPTKVFSFLKKMLNSSLIDELGEGAY